MQGEHRLFPSVHNHRFRMQRSFVLGTLPTSRRHMTSDAATAVDVPADALSSRKDTQAAHFARASILYDLCRDTSTRVIDCFESPTSSPKPTTGAHQRVSFRCCSWPLPVDFAEITHELSAGSQRSGEGVRNARGCRILD